MKEKRKYKEKYVFIRSAVRGGRMFCDPNDERYMGVC